MPRTSDQVSGGFLGETIFEPTAEVECDNEELVYL
jgi:hypothetical protein